MRDTTLIALLFLLSLPIFTVSAQNSEMILNIKVDQFGYRPAAPKIAVISSPQVGFNGNSTYEAPQTLYVVNYEDGKMVYSGTTEVWNNGLVHEQSGDRVWWFDFSNLTTEGHYFIIDSVNNVRSDVFTISAHVYNHVLKHAVRMLFYQRCGVAKESPFAESGWTDVACHVHNGQDKLCRPISGEGPVLDLSGGWHDAGDYNKYTTFAYSTVHQLLTSFEDQPNVFQDNYNIPESGNGIPDLLDEVKFELDFLQKMMLEDGSVLQKVSVTEHQGVSPPSGDGSGRYYAPPSSSATRSLASVFAHAYLVYNEIDELKEYASTLLEKAILAWNWVKENPGYSHYDNSGFSSANPERNEYDQDAYLFTAAVYLYKATGGEEYHNYIRVNYEKIHAVDWGYWYGYEYTYEKALLDYCTTSDSDDDICTQIHQSFRQSMLGEEFSQAVNNQTDAYRAFLKDGDYVWGSNSLKPIVGQLFYDYSNYSLTDDLLYSHTSEEYLHYIHGRNAIGKVFLTNMNEYGAQNSANEMYHIWFGDGTDFDDALTSRYGPAPGYLTGGVNKDYQPDGSYSGPSLEPPLNQPVQKRYKDWNTSWPENSWEITEPAIYYQASYILLLSKFASDQPVEIEVPEMITTASSNIEKNEMYPYPVPADQYLIVPVVHPNLKRVELINNRGQVIPFHFSRMEQGENQIKLDLKDVQDMFLIVRMVYAKEIESYKVVMGQE